MPVIEVIVSPLGEIRLTTQGFVGPACQDATRALEAALGLVRSDEKIAAYYQSAVQDATVVTRPDGSAG